MFKSLKGNPRTVIVLKYSRKKKWVDLGTITDVEGINFLKASRILQMFQTNEAERVNLDTFNDTKFRLIVRGKKSGREVLVLSTDNESFFLRLNNIRNNPHVIILVDGEELYSDSANPYFYSLNDLMLWTWKHNGILKAKGRTICPEDGNLSTYDITFVDGEKHTFSFLYT